LVSSASAYSHCYTPARIGMKERGVLVSSASAYSHCYTSARIGMKQRGVLVSSASAYSHCYTPARIGISTNPLCMHNGYTEAESRRHTLHGQAHRLEHLQPVRRAAQLLDACSGWASARNVPRLVAHSRDVTQRAVEVLIGRVAAARAGRSPPSPEACDPRRRSAPRVLRGMLKRSPLEHARVKGVSALTTSSSTWRQVKRRLTFTSSAPGSKCASQSTWKPLQMPSTSPPSRAKAITDSIAGEKRAIAPARR